MARTRLRLEDTTISSTQADHLPFYPQGGSIPRDPACKLGPHYEEATVGEGSRWILGQAAHRTLRSSRESSRKQRGGKMLSAHGRGMLRPRQKGRTERKMASHEEEFGKKMNGQLLLGPPWQMLVGELAIFHSPQSQAWPAADTVFTPTKKTIQKKGYPGARLPPQSLVFLFLFFFLGSHSAKCPGLGTWAMPLSCMTFWYHLPGLNFSCK